jgi:hypothetical protein
MARVPIYEDYLDANPKTTKPAAPAVTAPTQAQLDAAVVAAQKKVNAAKTPLAKAQTLLEFQKARLAAAEGTQVILTDLSNQAKADVQTFKTVAAETRAVAETTMKDLNLVKNTVTGTVTAAPTSSRQIIRQKLVDLGFPANIIEGSISFVQALVDDGDYPNTAQGFLDATEVLYNFKDFTTRKGTKLTSPFYSEFTSLGEGLVGEQRKSPKYLMEFSLAVKDLVAKTGFSTKFASQDSLKKYVQNGVRVTDLDERFAAATLKTAEANPNDVKALQAMGYINGAQDLKDFYADPEIGQDELNRRRTNVAFAKQAIKRADSGIAFNKTRIEQLAAGTGNELDAEATAAQGYETIGQQLNPLTFYEGIYGNTGKSDVALRSELQTQLEEEQFRGTASELRKRRKQQAELAFQAKPGTIGASRMSGGSLGTTSTIGSV